MKEKGASSENPQVSDDTTTALEPSKEAGAGAKRLKSARRVTAWRKFRDLDVCMLCGDRATQRHSKSGHLDPADESDIVPVCDRCHATIHSEDRSGFRVSRAWRYPA